MQFYKKKIFLKLNYIKVYYLKNLILQRTVISNCSFFPENMEKMKLTSGYDMPVLGLGTWQASSEIVTKAVLTALEVGYRHIDTAYNYKNEEAIGDGLKQWINLGNLRQSVFITTKLPHVGNRPEDVEVYLSRSLKRLRLDYVDLYLVHMPFTLLPDETGDAPAKNEDGSVVLDNTDHTAVWREMERLVDSGKIRSIGVSNFNKVQLERLCSNALIQPSCLQIEMHAALQQKALLEFCKQRNIIVTAYSPLGSPGIKDHLRNKYQLSIDVPDILHSDLVTKLAQAHKRTPAQILLRHLVQLGVSVIPKSANPDRIAENAKIFDFELTSDEMEEMNQLDQGSKGRIINFLFFKGIEKHPEYPFQEEFANIVKPSQINS